MSDENIKEIIVALIYSNTLNEGNTNEQTAEEIVKVVKVLREA